MSKRRTVLVRVAVQIGDVVLVCVVIVATIALAVVMLRVSLAVDTAGAAEVKLFISALVGAVIQAVLIR